jgi:hypothetical protein
MMSESTETISGVQPNSAPPLGMTELTGPVQNGDLAVTIGRVGRHLQAFYGVERRSVTPEVAGSSPVAPVSKFLQSTICAIQVQRDLAIEAVTVFDGRRRSRFGGFAAPSPR